MISERLEEVARQYEQAATECEAAPEHLKMTASHFRDGEVPRACAHSWAALGHFVGAERLLKELAEELGFNSSARLNSFSAPVQSQSKLSLTSPRDWCAVFADMGLIQWSVRPALSTYWRSELQARQVHKYDIADLLGHTIQSVTGTYARSTPDALEDALNRLTEPRGNVIQFKRKAS